MKNLSYTFKAVIVSVIFWLMDTVADRFFHQEDGYEFIPSEINELWMRLTIVLLFIGFGFYDDKQTKSLLKKEAEKLAIFNAK